MYRLLVPLIALALTACEPASRSDETAPPVPDTATQGAREDGQPANGDDENGAPAGIRLQTLVDQAYDRDEAGHLTVLDQMNEPGHVDVEAQENRHIRNQIDTLRTLHYDGLSLAVYDVSGGKEILQRVTVTDDDHATDEGLHVGMSRNELEDVRGDPTERRNGAYVYNLGGQMPHYLRADFEGDTVSRLQWTYPVD